ncbi:MAG: Ribosomal large subunit pseudouridine synthase B [Candidatus Anoxychlamydiales bacterium]|nr:Ribosomal large subunit pseudouridine synthase B [Candidatus Anoxychlamydiales bacterium]NGX36067.1 Ribosomal large subunit pseudouridine synthase B [Candidatus Anoxychlamydiales bacterium]
MSQMRLNKFLAHSGIASRRKVEDLIFSKIVKVNGVVEIKPQRLIDPTKDSVKVNDKVVKEEKKYYFILNKPKGYLCSNVKKGKEKLVIDLFKDFSERLFTIGRLDKDTTGLLIITNDGDFANKIIHPSANLEKEYIAKVKENITDTHLKTISKGAFVENKFVKPKRVVKVRKSTLKIIVTEGKKREVKTFIKRANLTLLELQRVRIGKLRLGAVPYGFAKKVSLEHLSNSI